jgi:molybdopterin molybdotransferase
MSAYYLDNAALSRVVSYADASRIVQEHAVALAGMRLLVQSTSLLDALGLVLAEPVFADRDQPPFPRSTRDGFACRAADAEAGQPLTILGLIRAGEAGLRARESVALKAGEAVEIMTGASVPAGADCVVMIEHVQRIDNTLRLSQGRSIAAGENIVPMGAEARKGDVILPPGTRMAAAQVGAAAACGAAELRIFTRPRVAIVATGDELVEVNEPLLTHQIRNSNTYSLAAQVLAAGGQAVRLPIARDERGPLEAAIRTGCEADLLLLSGGVSMGKYDLVEEVLLSLGAEFFFTGALIQPGKPVVFGRIAVGGRLVYIFGLPGNPVSTIVTFSLFAGPLLAVLCGEPYRGPRFAQGRLARDVRVKTGLTRFLPATIGSVGGEVAVELIAWQGSGDLANTSRSNCFLVVPADRPLLAAAETVTVLL